MSYYHIYVEARLEKNRKRICLLSLNNSEEKIRQISDSYLKDETFSFVEEIIHPSQIHHISVFRSIKPAEGLFLPNGKTVAEYRSAECMPIGCCKHKYIGKCLVQGRVEDVTNCTEEIIPIPSTRRRRKP